MWGLARNGLALARHRHRGWKHAVTVRKVILTLAALSLCLITSCKEADERSGRTEGSHGALPRPTAGSEFTTRRHCADVGACSFPTLLLVEDQQNLHTHTHTLKEMRPLFRYRSDNQQMVTFSFINVLHRFRPLLESGWY